MNVSIIAVLDTFLTVYKPPGKRLEGFVKCIDSFTSVSALITVKYFYLFNSVISAHLINNISVTWFELVKPLPL